MIRCMKGEKMYLQQLATSVLSIFAMCTLCILTILNHFFSNKEKKYFLISCFIAISIISVEIIYNIYDMCNLKYNMIYYVLTSYGFIITPIIPFTLAKLISPKLDHWGKLYLVPSVINIVLQLTNPFTNLVFTISPNSYDRGPFYFIFIIAYISSIVFLARSSFFFLNKHQDNSKYMIIVLFIFIITATAVQIVNENIHLTWTSVTIAFVMLYAFLCELFIKTDSLSNLLNRKMYDYYLNKLSNKRHGCIILFDINKFKDINDNWGHIYGDECIRNLSSIIKLSFSNIGYSFRVGGDEFAVISNTKDVPSIEKCIDNLNKSILKKQERDVKLPSLSVGYCIYKKNEMDIVTAINIADENMYQNKKAQVD